MSAARKVGVFVLITLALIAAMILNFSKGRGIFTSTYTVRIISSGVGGLKVGAPVTLSGVAIGSVSHIDLTPDRKSVEIQARILRKYPVRHDAKFEIEQSGFLGDEYVAILPGGDTAPYLADDESVKSEKPFNLQEAARSATALIGKLDTAVDRINSAIERVDRQLLTDATLTNLVATAANLRSASADAGLAVGDVRRLVTNNSPAVAATVSNLNVLTLTLRATATNLDTLVADQRPALRQVLSNAGAATADFKLITEDLRAGKGAAGALLADESLRLQIGSAFTNLATVSSNLARFGLLYKPPQPKVRLTNQVKYPGRDPWNSSR